MGDYKSQYEKYYDEIRKNTIGKSTYNRQKKPEIIKDENPSSKRYINKLLKQFCGAGILLTLLFIAKNIPLQGTQEMYIVSKKIVDKNLGLTESVMAINIPEFNDYKEKTLDFIDKCKTLVTGGKTLKEVINKDYIVPLSGKYSRLGDGETGVVIQVSNQSDVVSSYDGIVKEIKDTTDGGKHIIIDNGNGIETYYGLLSSTALKVGNKVEKGSVIGKTGIVDSLNSQGVVFKIIYMGIEKDPTQIMDFSKQNGV